MSNSKSNRIFKFTEEAKLYTRHFSFLLDIFDGVKPEEKSPSYDSLKETGVILMQFIIDDAEITVYSNGYVTYSKDKDGTEYNTVFHVNQVSEVSTNTQGKIIHDCYELTAYETIADALSFYANRKYDDELSNGHIYLNKEFKPTPLIYLIKEEYENTDLVMKMFKMSQNERAVIDSIYIKKKSAKQTAKKLGLTLTSVYDCLARAAWILRTDKDIKDYTLQDGFFLMQET